MADRVPGLRAEQSARVLIKSVGITTLGGLLVGAAGFHFISARSDGGWGGVQWLPLTMLFSIPFTLPFGMVCGIVAAIVLEILLRSSFRSASRRAWITLGGAMGLALGALCPIFLHAIRFGMDAPYDPVFGGFGASAGVCCGLMLGWLGWAESRRRVGPARATMDG